MKLFRLVYATVTKRSELPEYRDAVQCPGRECLVAELSKLTNTFIDCPIPS
jgi:hypothetical protein